MSVKMRLEFSGFADLIEAIDRAEGDVNEAVTEALYATQDVVTEQVKKATRQYVPPNTGLHGYAHGAMVEAIIDGDEPVRWLSPTVAEIPVGFSSKGGAALNGFMHSIWVMYGNNKGMEKDQKVWNAVKGAAVQRKVHQKQQEVLQKYLDLTRGK